MKELNLEREFYRIIAFLRALKISFGTSHFRSLNDERRNFKTGSLLHLKQSQSR